MHTMCGLLAGCLADSVLQERERAFLIAWMQEHEDVRSMHPFDELFPALEDALSCADAPETLRCVLDDVIWLMTNESKRLADPVDSDLQTLLGLLGGIAADGHLCDVELQTLRAWLSEHEHLVGIWPYDELGSLVLAALRDGVVDAQEREELLRYFAEFSRSTAHRAIGPFEGEIAGTVVGLCAVQPSLTFAGSTFCFTGSFRRHTRETLARTVEGAGARFVNSVTRSVDYLVVGAEGSPCWTHACYGRKVEQAVQLRRSGAHILIVHESDFLDALADEGLETV
jgi:NAD-dependent DNA ligase